ncbi:hypothetical protein LWI29_013185 [Acer saccharum]|uniref:Uncharacterized protein n=1 Tax=Acer saccharum TaxID=4024 RepID=A0AA39W671_ACESA|nr:hypothetical protein LWI29_013185 [Acer saccharum]
MIPNNPKRKGGSYVVENGPSIISDNTQPNDQALLLAYSENGESFVEETQVASQGKILGQGLKVAGKWNEEQI